MPYLALSGVCLNLTDNDKQLSIKQVGASTILFPGDQLSPALARLRLDVNYGVE